MMLDHPTGLIEEVRTELQDVRIRLAQLRDDMLTDAELAVMLKVCEEFGRCWR